MNEQDIILHNYLLNLRYFTDLISSYGDNFLNRYDVLSAVSYGSFDYRAKITVYFVIDKLYGTEGLERELKELLPDTVEIITEVKASEILKEINFLIDNNIHVYEEKANQFEKLFDRFLASSGTNEILPDIDGDFEKPTNPR